MKNPVIDLGCCNLCGVCTEVCPRVFKLSDAGFIEVAELSEYPDAEVEEAVKYCPEQCIRYEEEAS